MTTRYLTQADVDNYGPELLDVSQRAALHAVAPHLQALNQQNARLQGQLAQEARHRLDQQVERAVPNYREIDRDPRWHQWLLGIDPLNGKVRQQLLNGAIAAGSATRVKGFFDGFQRDAGRMPQTARSTSDRSVQPTYTHEQIGQLYAKHRRGEFTEAAWARIEADIFAAQREGRIHGVYLTK
jgi:hypothetical protein